MSPRKIIVFISFFVISGGVQAQQNAEQQTFLAKCNPQRKPELTKSCGCLMQSIERSLTLAEFNKLDAREAAGQLSDSEIRQKARLVAYSKPAFRECMGR